MKRREIVKVALGKEPADTAIVGGRVVNVHTLEIHEGDVAIKGDRIAAVGDVAHTIGDTTTVIDAGEAFVTPGLVDGHLHMYHSYLGIREFVEAMLRHGVTSTADGFYGQGIVGGPDAVRFFKDAFGTMPIRLIFLVPTLAYLQNRELGLTPAPGISKDEMFEMLAWPDCRGLEEPPFLPITWEWEEFLDLFEATLDAGKVISGHASGITSRELQAYVGMGAATDHETVESLDGLEKVRAGMKLLMREGSGCTNVAELSRVRTEHGVDGSTLGFCADVASPEKLWRDGGVDQNIRVAIAHGIDPAEAVRMASFSVAQTFRRDHDLGSVTAGRYADILLVDDLPSFHIRTVLFGGQVAVSDGNLLAHLPDVTYPASFYDTVQLSTTVAAGDLRVRAPAGSDHVVVRALEVKEGTLVTRETMHDLEVRDGIVQRRRRRRGGRVGGAPAPRSPLGGPDLRRHGQVRARLRADQAARLRSGEPLLPARVQRRLRGDRRPEDLGGRSGEGRSPREGGRDRVDDRALRSRYHRWWRSRYHTWWIRSDASGSSVSGTWEAHLRRASSPRGSRPRDSTSTGCGWSGSRPWEGSRRPRPPMSQTAVTR
jgi:adenine deaminase